MTRWTVELRVGTIHVISDFASISARAALLEDDSAGYQQVARKHASGRGWVPGPSAPACVRSRTGFSGPSTIYGCGLVSSIVHPVDVTGSGGAEVRPVMLCVVFVVRVLPARWSLFAHRLVEIRSSVCVAHSSFIPLGMDLLTGGWMRSGGESFRCVGLSKSPASRALDLQGCACRCGRSALSLASCSPAPRRYEGKASAGKVCLAGWVLLWATPSHLRDVGWGAHVPLRSAPGQAYHNVLASTPVDAYRDAGELHFASSSSVRSEFSVGYRARPTYCVAPTEVSPFVVSARFVCEVRMPEAQPSANGVGPFYGRVGIEPVGSQPRCGVAPHTYAHTLSIRQTPRATPSTSFGPPTCRQSACKSANALGRATAQHLLCCSPSDQLVFVDRICGSTRANGGVALATRLMCLISQSRAVAGRALMPTPGDARHWLASPHEDQD